MKDAAEFLVEDPRHPAEMLTRSELARTCVHNKLPITPGAPKKIMVTLVKDAGIDVTKGFPGAPFRFEQEQVHVKGEGTFIKTVVRRGMLRSERPQAQAARDRTLDDRLQQAAQVTPDDVRAQIDALQAQLTKMQRKAAPPQSAPEALPEGDYSGMTMPNLRKLCKARGVKFLPTTTKVELVDLLNGKDAP